MHTSFIVSVLAERRFIDEDGSVSACVPGAALRIFAAISWHCLCFSLGLVGMVVTSIPLLVLLLGIFEDVYYEGSCFSWSLRASLQYLKKSWGWYVLFESLEISFPCRHDAVIYSIKSCCWLGLKPQKSGFALYFIYITVRSEIPRKWPNV